MKGLFAGYSSFIIRDLPFDALEFVAYEQLKKGYATAAQKHASDVTGWETGIIGEQCALVQPGWLLWANPHSLILACCAAYILLQPGGNSYVGGRMTGSGRTLCHGPKSTSCAVLSCTTVIRPAMTALGDALLGTSTSVDFVGFCIR